jgi:small-conductance mechanosensitive channel
MLSLGALWFVVPVLAGAARPLRRPPTRSLGESWDRAADFVIASLVGAWAVQQILQALPGLAGMQLPIAKHADTAAACVLAALAVRLAAETIASHLYPQRLDTAEAGHVPQPGTLQRLGASALRTTLFVFFGYIVAGTSWQLWVAAALFVAPQILSVYKQHLPNFPWLFRTRPRGLLRIVLMLFVATVIGALLLHTMDKHAQSFLADSVVILALPGFVLALLPVFGREGDEAATGWGKRIAGIAILAAGILLALGRLL